MIIKEKAFESFTWIDIEKANKKELEVIASKYNLNYFLIKDALDIGHLPKYEQLHQHDFFIFRAYTSNVRLNIDEIGEMSNKIAFFIFDDKLITIHRAHFPFLNLEEEKDIKISEFFLKIVGCMIDSFKTPTLEISDKITQIEKTIFLKDYRAVLIEELYYIKTQSRILKKIISITEATILKSQDKYKISYIYQDIQDTLLNLLTVNEESVDNSTHLMNTYLSLSDQKNNEVVRLLTIFSVFFLPLNFIAGVYGMNFSFMPELSWKLGYAFALCLMAIVVVVIYLWFRRKRIL
jgi:magnesium transporter